MTEHTYMVIAGSTATVEPNPGQEDSAMAAVHLEAGGSGQTVDLGLTVSGARKLRDALTSELDRIADNDARVALR